MKSWRRVTSITIYDLRFTIYDFRSANRLIRYLADVADFEIGATTTLTREHPLAPDGKACVITNALKRLQDVLVRGGPICVVMDA
jgi:hypothetical protein